MLKSPATGIDLSGAPLVNVSKQICALLKLCFKVWQNRTFISRDVHSAVCLKDYSDCIWQSWWRWNKKSKGISLALHALKQPSALHYPPASEQDLPSNSSRPGFSPGHIEYWDLGPGEKQWKGGEETQTNQVEEQALETTVRKSESGKMTTT